MATGESKARREARKQAAAAYYKALRESERMAPIKRVDSQGRRKLSNQLGDDMSGRAKRLARQADTVARQINEKSGEFNAKVGAYNDRYDALQKQLASATGISKGVDYAKDLEGWRTSETARLQQERERLMAEDQAASNANPVRQYGFVVQKPAAPSPEQQSRQKRLHEIDAEIAEVDRRSRGLNDSYRNLDSLELAYNELATLAKEVQGYEREPEQQAGLVPQLASQMKASPLESPIGRSPATNAAASPAQDWRRNPFDPERMTLNPNSAGAQMGEFSKQYEAIGQKLKQQIERDQRMGGQTKAADPTGLLQSELASAAPVQEVIR